MSTWRRKALDLLPDSRLEFENPDTNIYAVFIEVLPALEKAQEQKDRARIQQIFEFAEWCFRQKQKDLWNAAGVCFYEHLDSEESLKQMHLYVKPDIYKQVRPLLELRIRPDQLKKLDESFTQFRLKR